MAPRRTSRTGQQGLQTGGQALNTGGQAIGRPQSQGYLPPGYPSPQTSAQRRSAQRRLAREIRTGTYQRGEAGQAYQRAISPQGRLARERAGKPMKVAVDLDGNGLPALVSGLNKPERQLVYRHWLALIHYAETGEEGDFVTYGRPSLAKILAAGNVEEINIASRTKRRYRNKGLVSFRGVTVGGPRASGIDDRTGNDIGIGPFLLLTDLDQIDLMANNHEIDPENFYPSESATGAMAA